MLYIFLLIGAGLALCGFFGMRDPIRFALLGSLSPQMVGYHQRQVLDRRHRIQLRGVGMFLSFFGLMIVTSVLDGVSKAKLIHAISETFLGLLGVTFVSLFIAGLIDLIVQGIRGRGPDQIFGWYKMLKQSMELGPVAAFPSFSPRMDKEKRVFTAVYFVLIAATIVLAFVINLP